MTEAQRTLRHCVKPILFAVFLAWLIPGIMACAVSSKLTSMDLSRSPKPIAPPVNITSLTTEETEKDVQLSIIADGPFSYYMANHENPFRLTIDFDSARFVDLPPEQTVKKGPVETIKLIPGGGVKQGGRVEIVLQEKGDYEINKRDNNLLITLSKESMAPGLPEAERMENRKGKLENRKGKMEEKGPPTPIQTPIPSREQDYLIGGKDVLDISVYGEPDLTKTMRVSSRGTISFPLIGTVPVEGLTPSQVEQKLEELLTQGYLKNPQVSIMVKEYHSKEVFVVGLVKKPGVYPLTGPTTLLEMISKAGGLVADVSGRGDFGRASKELVLLRHESDEIKYIRVDLERLLDKGDMSLNLLLKAEDTLYIPQVGAVYIFGEVRQPGPYELARKDTTLVETINMAGGFTEAAAPNRVKVIRVEGGQEKTLNVNINEITKKGEKSKDIVLKDGDVVVVPQSFF